MSIETKDYWEETPVDITAEANFIWGIANKLRGSYMPDKYGDVIIPMTIIRRMECALADTKGKVVEQYEKNKNYPAKAMYWISGHEFYNTSRFTLEELCNDPDYLAANFKSYIHHFSANVQDILKELEIEQHIDKMEKDGCLFNVVQAFSALDLSPNTFDSIKMGYIFENLIGRFYQNVDAGQFYTGRDIIKMLVSVLTSEGCDDIFDQSKVITIGDQACGTGGMLSTAYTYLSHLNPSADIRLFGQEFMGQSYAVGLAEMLIKDQEAENFHHADTLKEDCNPDVKMRFMIENPPFGTPWSGKDAKAGQEKAVQDEYRKGMDGRWGAGLPAGGDSQLLFMQSAIAKLDENVGRAAIITNGSPLFTGGVSSGESQIRRWLLESDLIEAIIAMPTELFYNTGIATYAWILSKNKREERKGKMQLIDAANICHKLRKPMGNKKNEFTPEDRKAITELYTSFEENELSQVHNNREFIYREYTVMQPLQRSYAITEERIEGMLKKGSLDTLYNEAFLKKIDGMAPNDVTAKDRKRYDGYAANKPIYDRILEILHENTSDKVYLSPGFFQPMITKLLGDVADKKLIPKIMDGLSVMDKNAVIQTNKKGVIQWDTETKDTENVNIDEDIDVYMKREVLPHVPDAQAFFEEDMWKKKPVIKTGAEIPFTRYFYKYQQPAASGELEKKFEGLERLAAGYAAEVFG